MEKYSFFDAQKTSSGYDRTYSSSDLADYFASFIGNGVFANPANSLMVQAGSGLQVVVKTGMAFINGYYYQLKDEAKSLAIARGDNNYPRIDTVICSLNHSKRLIEVKVVQGNAAASPVAPAMVRSSIQHDLVLAEITIPAGATAISDAQIKDTRADNSKCGFVSGVVEQINTTDLFKQYDSAFNQWFETQKGTLSGDVAGNLSNSLQGLTTRLETAEKKHTADIKKVSTDISKSNDENKIIKLSVQNLENKVTTLENQIVMGKDKAPNTAKPNTIYLQLL